MSKVIWVSSYNPSEREALIGELVNKGFAKFPGDQHVLHIYMYSIYVEKLKKVGIETEKPLEIIPNLNCFY